MNPLKAHVRGGRLLLDEPTELPDGTEVELVMVDDDEFDPEERARLVEAIEAGEAANERGEFVDGIEFANQLVARHEAANRSSSTMTFVDEQPPHANDGRFAKDPNRPTFIGRQWKGQDVHALPLAGTGIRGGGSYDQSALAVHNHACVEDDDSDSGFKSICGKVKPKNILGDTSGGWADDPKTIDVTCPHCKAKLDKSTKEWAGKKLAPPK